MQTKTRFEPFTRNCILLCFFFQTGDTEGGQQHGSTNTPAPTSLSTLGVSLALFISAMNSRRSRCRNKAEATAAVGTAGGSASTLLLLAEDASSTNAEEIKTWHHNTRMLYNICLYRALPERFRSSFVATERNVVNIFSI